MTQKLVVPITFQIEQQGSPVRTETVEQDVIRVGRDPKSHLQIDDEGVQRRHAVIEVKPGDVQIIDLVSATTVNGQLTSKATLNTGDVIQIGSTRITVSIGAPREVTAAPPAFVAPSVAAPLSASMASAVVSEGIGPITMSNMVEGEEFFQLIKRGEINPHEVEEVGAQAVEVSVMWKSSILHVAHLNGSNFVLTARQAQHAPAAQVAGAAWGIGGILMMVGAAYADPNDLTKNTGLIVGGVGALAALAGSGVGVSLSNKNEDRIADTAHFTVGAEMLGGADELPVVLTNQGTRFVFLPNATGEVELQGVKRSLDELKAAGHARPSSVVPGGFEVNIQPEGRYRQEVNGLTLVAKVVAPGRVVAGHLKRDPGLVGSILGAGLFVLASVLTMRYAISDESGFLSSANEDDRLAELRAFIQRQQERQPEQQQQQNNDQQEGGTGTRHRGDEGKMGKRDAPQRSARYAIKNNNEPPHLSREAARSAVQNRGIFAALGAPGGGMAGGSSGIVSPFGQMTESGVDDRNANGNMTGDAVGDAFGYGGLGATGTGWGGGGTGEGTIGMGNIGTMGHGSGTGSGQGYGAGAGRGLRNRGNSGPTVRAAPPSVTGLLSPEAIRRVVLRNLGQVNHCYEQTLATSPNAAGRVVIRFVIGGTGTVIGSSVSDSSIPVPSLGECVANAVRRWQFPAPEGGGVVTVNYPFNLQPADQ